MVDLRSTLPIGKPMVAEFVRTLSAAGYMPLVIVLYGSLTLFRLGVPDLASDEGRFGLSAINLLTDYRQFALVSQAPQGGPGTLPYAYPLALAASLMTLGKSEFALRFVNVVALFAGAVMFSRAVRLLGKEVRLGQLVFAVFLLNPATITYARYALPEAFVVACGCAALLAAAKASTRGSVAWGALCGLALATTFLVKLWLVVPFVLACGAIFLVARPTTASVTLRGAAGAALLVFATGSASHLFLVVLLAPNFLGHWLDVYYGFAFKSRLAGAGYDPVLWYRPWWFYLAALFKASFWGLPFVLLGAWYIVKARDMALVLLVAALLSPVLLLSVFRVKQASYIYASVLAVSILLAVGLPAFLQKRTLTAVLVASGLAAAAAALCFASGVITSAELLLIGGLYGVYLICALVTPFYGRWARFTAMTALAGVLLYAGIAVVQKTLLHRTYFREIAGYFAPAVASTKPTDVVFTSPEAPAMEFYTYRRGVYWRTFRYQQGNDEFIRELECPSKLFYVVDQHGWIYGGEISPEKLATLKTYAAEVTLAIEHSARLALPVSVFVPKGQKCK